jgi:hypothetical protein
VPLLLSTNVPRLDITTAATTSMTSLLESVTGAVDLAIALLLPQVRDSRTRMADARLTKATPAAVVLQLTVGPHRMPTPAMRTLSERGSAPTLPTRVAAMVETEQVPRLQSDRRAGLASTAMTKVTARRRRCAKALPLRPVATTPVMKIGAVLAMSDHPPRWGIVHAATAVQDRRPTPTLMDMRHPLLS